MDLISLRPNRTLLSYNQAMYLRQRQESLANSSIEGKRINNYVSCSVKEVRTLSPQIVEMAFREETFETDSFKQILTKRSQGPISKENLSCNSKKLRRMKEQQNESRSEERPQPKSKKSSDAKKSMSSLNKLIKIAVVKEPKKPKQPRKSLSPMRECRQYKSGPADKRIALSSLNPYVSVNVHSKSSREGIVGSKSERNLTNRVKNPLKGIQNQHNKKEEKPKMSTTAEKVKQKRRKNVSKANLFGQSKKPASTILRTESLAKMFDTLAKGAKPKRQNKLKKQKSQVTSKKETSKGKAKKSKEKKVIVSNNNSRAFIQKVKVPSDFSDDSRESPDKMLSVKYQQERNMRKKKRERLSFEPSKKRPAKKSHNIKTEALSPDHGIMSHNESTSALSKNIAATVIQKNFRMYITRKNYLEYQKVMGALIKIQSLCRGYLARKRVRKMKAEQKRAELKKMERIEQLMEQARPNDMEANQLLQFILGEQNVNERIKSKIVDFLSRESRSSIRSKSSARSSVANHSVQEMKSEKKFIERRKMYNLNSPVIRCSPLGKSEIYKSPQLMVESLLTIQQFHREKLITKANMQYEGLQDLAMRNVFSPRTHENKRKQIEERLRNDLKKFDNNIDEIIQSCKDDEDIRLIQPFDASVTPERSSSPKSERSEILEEPSPQLQQSNRMTEEPINNSEPIEPINSSERKLQDLSMELLEYYEQKTQPKGENKYEPFDSSYQFIEEYLLTLFEYMRQNGEQFWHEFNSTMKEPKNLALGILLRNLNTVTEDSEDDISFKLPMYKYLEQEDKEIISRQFSEEFNEAFTKLQRHQLSYHHINLEDMYLKMLIDCMNESLNAQRPSSYPFVEAALSSRRDGIRVKEIEALQSEDCTESEAQFCFFFAKAMNQIFQWAHQQCGNVCVEEDDMENVMEMNEKKMKEYLKKQAESRWDYYDELMEVIVGLADAIVDQVILEEGISLYF